MAAVVVVARVRAGGLGDLQWMVWVTLLRGVLLTALLPQMVPAGASYLVVAPIDDRKWWKDNGGLGFGLTVGVTPAG